MNLFCSVDAAEPPLSPRAVLKRRWEGIQSCACVFTKFPKGISSDTDTKAHTHISRSLSCTLHILRNVVLSAFPTKSVNIPVLAKQCMDIARRTRFYLNSKTSE